MDHPMLKCFRSLAETPPPYNPRISNQKRAQLWADSLYRTLIWLGKGALGGFVAVAFVLLAVNTEPLIFSLWAIVVAVLVAGRGVSHAILKAAGKQ